MMSAAATGAGGAMPVREALAAMQRAVRAGDLDEVRCRGRLPCTGTIAWAPQY